MSYDEHDFHSFYDDNSIEDDPKAEDIPAGYYVKPTPMGGRRHSRRVRKCMAGILVLAVMLAATLGIIHLVRDVGISLERSGGSFTLSVGTKNLPAASAQETIVPDTGTALTAPAEVEEPTAPVSGISGEAYVGSGATLDLVDSPAGAATTSSASEDALSLQDIYSKVIDSVVSISTTLSNGTATGTGIIMSADGYIITNYHVIDGALSITVLTEDESQYAATLVGGDETSDLAVLKVDTKSLQSAEFGDSDVLQVGDSVVAIGDPLGIQLRGTMTNGIISAINRDLTVNNRKMTLIQTNAALNNGNSGGPLINCYGQVIGVNTMKMSSYYTSASVEGLGFAIPISVAKPIIDELIANGYVAGRPAIGINGEALPKTVQTYYRLPNGIYLTYVDPHSDAAAKGLVEGDIITAINGTDVTTIDELNTVKNQFMAGDTVTLRIYRSGSYSDVDIILMDQALLS